MAQITISPTKQSLYSLAPQQNGISIGKKEMTADADMRQRLLIDMTIDDISF